MRKIDYKAAPFYLSDTQIKWVEDTFARMTLKQKAGQVFCPLGVTSDENFLCHTVKELGVGGIMYRPGSSEEVQGTHRKIQEMAEIPLLIAANTEAGGNGISNEGTSFGCPMAVAATNDTENAYRMGYVACKEGAALGLNWSFAPIVDINYEFHNPITNTRTFGSDPGKVIDCASRYMDGAKENGVAVAIKHFPGDGVDERDQHILTSVNSLSVEDWMESYGKVYRSLIQKGAETVMVGHIALPAWIEKKKPNASKREKLLPATLSREIMTGLLREELGFNGVISTDSTPMIGFTCVMPRREAIPAAIEAGADIILFNKSLDEDIGYLLSGLVNGLLSEQRLDDAVLRILALKSSLRLPEKKAAGCLVPGKEQLSDVGCALHRKWAKETADKAITLVRDEQSLLPITPQKYKRIYLNVIQKDMDPNHPIIHTWKTLLEKEGFTVTVRDRRVTITPEDFSEPNLSEEKQRFLSEMYRSVEDMKKDYDLYLYVANMQNASNNTTLRLNWRVTFGLGDDAPWMTGEIPVLMVSTGYPYHLFDAPMIGTYINAYSDHSVFIRATIDKLMGRSSFKGVSPADPFCGKSYI